MYHNDYIRAHHWHRSVLYDTSIVVARRLAALRRVYLLLLCVLVSTHYDNSKMKHHSVNR